MLGAPARCNAADDEGGVGDVQQRVSPAPAGRETASLRSCAHDTAREVGSRAGGGELRARDGLAAHGAGGRVSDDRGRPGQRRRGAPGDLPGRRASAHGLRSARVVPHGRGVARGTSNRPGLDARLALCAVGRVA